MRDDAVRPFRKGAGVLGAATRSVTRRPAVADLLSCLLLAGAIAGSWLAYGRSDLTLDEGYTSAETRLPLGALLRVMFSRELNGSLHTLLMWLLDQPGPTLLRLASTVFMVVALLLLHRFVRAHFGPWPAFVSLVLAATNPAIQQDMVIGRTYALSMLLLMISFLLLDIAWREGGTLRFVLWGSLCGVMVYAHFITALVVAGQVVWLLFSDRDRWRQWVVGVLAGLIFLLPVGFFFVSGGGAQGQLITAPPLSVGGMLSGVLDVIAGYGRGSSGTRAIVVLLVVGVLVCGSGRATRRYASLGAITFLVPVVTLAVAAVHAPSLFSERYLVFMVPGLAIAVGAGIRGCVDRSARSTLIASTLLAGFSAVFCVLGVVAMTGLSWTETHPWTAAMRAIGPGRQVTTAVSVEGYLAGLYAQSAGAYFVPAMPRDAATFLGQSRYDDRECSATGRPTGPLWVVSTMSPDFESAYRRLADCWGYRPGVAYAYGSVKVIELLPAG